MKRNFFVRYREFESYAHLNQPLERWLRDEADPRIHGTVREVVAARFLREAPTLTPLPAVRFDTAYREPRHDGWVVVPEHHAALWEKTLRVERRPLETYEEVAPWN